MKSSGLGKGLSALLGSINEAEDVKVQITRKESGENYTKKSVGNGRDHSVREKSVKSKKKKVEKSSVKAKKPEQGFEEITRVALNDNGKTRDDRNALTRSHVNSKLETEYQYIPVNKVITNPYQPRKVFDETAISELAQSIASSGFITPIVVTISKNGDYVLVAGERRLRACKELGLAEIPAIVKDLTETQMMQIAIVENVQRKNLNPIEEGKAYQSLSEKLNLDVEEISKMLGLPKYYISQKIKLVSLPTIIQNYVSAGELSESAAILFLKLDSEEAMIAAARIAVRQKMTRNSVEKLIEKILLSRGIEPKSQDYHYKSKYQFMLDAFKDNLGWKMKIKSNHNGDGKLEIDFLDEVELNEIYKKLENLLK
jgi:ParB family chromosome partitioning protein